MPKRMLLGVLTTTLLLTGCAGASVSTIRTPLNVGALSRTDSLVIKPAASDNTVFEGDYSDDPPSVADGRRRLRTMFATRAAHVLNAAGLKAALHPTQGDVVVEMVVQKFDAGSNAARAVVGFGAGASFLLTDVKLIKGGTVIADFTLDASSGGRGGFSSIGSWLDRHIDDSVRILRDYLIQNSQ